MELFPRSKSSPHLQKLDDVTYVIVGPDTLNEDEECTEGEFTEEDEEMSEMDEVKSTDTENISVSGDSVNNTFLSPDIHAYMSESDASPILHRKKRRAPLPPDMSPTMAERHSYAFDLNALRLRTSTDTESTTSDSRLFYQTSTDSESVLPESAHGSNFPGELAGVENVYPYSSRRPRARDTTLSQSPKGLSKLSKLREVFRSPQIVRKKSRKVKAFLEKTPRLRRMKPEDGDFSVTRRIKAGDESKSPKLRNVKSFDPIPEMSDCVLVGSYHELEAEQEFEVKRILDYEKFLSGLLEVTDSSHVDYVDISRNLSKVSSLMKEREAELLKEESPNMEGVELRSSQDNLSQESNYAIRDNTDNSSVTEQSNNITDQWNNNSKDRNEDTKTKRREQSQRRKSAPSAVLFKSLSNSKSKSPTSIWLNAGLNKKANDVGSQFKLTDGDSNSKLIMEGSVQFVIGMQIQERYLFLLGDLLLVTKQKSNTTFKLKHRVQLSDMWIASCIEDVSEITRPTDRSFVLGWPTTNVVATFPSVDLRDDWLTKLSENITKEKLKDEDKTLPMRIALRDVTSATSQICQMIINNYTQAKEVVLDCLKQINIPETGAKDYQLWVVSGKDGSPYPLIGHETPYSIKLSAGRELSRSQSDSQLDNVTTAELETVVEHHSPSGQKCEFYLRQKKSSKNRFEGSSQQKPMKKNKKSPNIFNTIFRRKRAVQHMVFGLPVSEICDENFDPPESIIKLMVLVYQLGPHTPGILRKGNNAALGKEIREKIDSGEKYNLENHMAPTAASVFKEFLRCLPDGLLMCSLHDQWLTFKKDDPHEVNINRIKIILGQLPPKNYHMIKLTICLLQHLAKHRSDNHMGPANLATCIAPSLYTYGATESPREKLKEDAQKQMQNSVNEIQYVIVPLISFMITSHVELFGEDILNMFVKYGCEPSPVMSLEEERYDSQMQPSAEEDEEEDMVGEEEDDEHFDGQCLKKQHMLQIQQRKQHMLRDSNSGTDSDSMHSVLSMQDAGVGLQRDDSSIDSLGDRDYYAHESPKAVKSHLSPSNLSRDSGLTLSDNQLYDEESYQIDIAATSMKMYSHQRALQFTDHHDTDLYDRSRFGQNVDVPFDRCVNPVAPPRTRSIRRKVDNDGRRYGFTEYSQKAPLTHSASTTHLEDSQNINRQTEHSSMLTHSSLDKRVSSESIGEEEEATDKPEPIDFQRMRERTDIGTLVKSESGTQLFLNEQATPRKFSLGASETKLDQHFMRQSSGASSILPMSTESRHSQSSCDSVISDSTCSISRDGSINSAPQTPDEPQDKSLNWVPDINLPGKPWQGMFTHNVNTQQSVYSKSPSDLLSTKEYNVDNLITDNTPKMWFGKSHETEEVQTNGKPHLSLVSRFNDSSIDASSQTSPPYSSASFGKQRFLTHSDSGSPPPSVLLKTLQTPAKRDVPLRADYDTVAHIRRSSEDSPEPRHRDISKDMQAIRREEIINLAFKPIIISPEGSTSNMASNNSSRAKLSKYISPQFDLQLPFKDRDFVPSQAKQHPIRPLNHNQAMQTNLTMKYNLPEDETAEDVTEAQRLVSARAKEMYEKSLQLFNQQRYDNSSETLKLSNVKSNLNQVSSNLVHLQASPSDSETDDTVASNLTAKKYLDTVHSDYASVGRLQTGITYDDPDNSGASGFLDMGSISSSLQEDIVSRRNRYAESIVSSDSKSINTGSLISLSRNDSKLSDAGSSSGSSLTISTLGKHSDSLGRCSDLSNTSFATVSSVTSSDSNSDITPTSSRHRSFTKHDQHLSRRSSETDAEVTENNDEHNSAYVTPSKDAEELYLQSMQIYEQTSGQCSSTLPRSKPSVIKSLFLDYQQHEPNTVPKISPSYTDTTSFSKQRNAEAERSKKSMARLSLEVPTSNLQRSRSDSSDRVNKLGSYGVRSTKTGGEDYENDKNTKQSRRNAYTESSKETNIKAPPGDIKSEHHQNFLRAKSCFHKPEIPKQTSSAISSHHSAQASHRSRASQDSRSDKLPEASFSSPVTADVTVASALMPEPGSKVPNNNPTDSTAREHNKEIYWSVKKMKSVYDKDKTKDV